VFFVCLVFGGLGNWHRCARQKRLAVSRVEQIGGSAWWDVTSDPDITIAPIWLTSRLPPEYFGAVASVSVPNAADNQLELLQPFTLLVSLQLWNSLVSDDGLRRVSQLRTLTSLNLGGDSFTDDGLSHLNQLTQLKQLWLRSSRIHGPALQHLTPLSGLKELCIDCAAITDGDIQHLSGLTHLEWLTLVGTQVTEAGALRLFEHLPECSIIVGAASGGSGYGASEGSGYGAGVSYFSITPGEGLIRADADSDM
jgi:hypothetical protein